MRDGPMQRSFPNLALISDSGPQISILVPVDRYCADPLAITRLVTYLGEDNAEAVIGRAVDHIAQRLGLAEDKLVDCDFAGMGRETRRLAAIALQLGLTEVSNIGLQISACSYLGDAVALSALLARLRRVFERARNDVWENLRIAP